MSNYISRAELDEISEGLIKVYISDKHQDIQSIDIDDFVKSFLNLRIEYAHFAEEDPSKIGFISDGNTPLLIYLNGRIVPFVFPKDTIVLDKFLLAKKENGRRRFTLAHEAAHYILERIQVSSRVARFHTEYDSQRTYTRDELAKMFAAIEWQADVMAASLLMPEFIVKRTVRRCAKADYIKIYGDNTLAAKDKLIISTMAKQLEVSHTALFIRLKNLGIFEYHDISEYISQELNLGGTLF